MPSIGAATTPSVSRATEVRMAFSTDSILDAPVPRRPSAKSMPMARAASSRLNPSFSSSLIRAAIPIMPISFSTRSARSTARGISTSVVGSFPKARAAWATAIAPSRPCCRSSKYSELFNFHLRDGDLCSTAGDRPSVDLLFSNITPVASTICTKGIEWIGRPR
ncbi:MAG: hypothetical protein A4E46_01609 [Methanosaeta sp. PtaU1.Bin016]|nr:MAG: hypothetical protein A4E46_01609 [Methanosaeta sp. PtaU1.Bin016]